MSAELLYTWAMVNCQPSSEPMQASTMAAITMSPTIGVNILANTRPNGAVDAASSSLPTIPKMTLVETM
ncbi:hypothetical protein D9M69_471510 [compost metagenome]